VVDTFYFSVTTLTTVGLGDLSPQTTVGKIFTVIYIFAGLSIILGFIDAVSEQTLGRRRRRRQYRSDEGQDGYVSPKTPSRPGSASVPC
jgi:voltage-gated potassium channel